jgi:hypothetical protein
MIRRNFLPINNQHVSTRSTIYTSFTIIIANVCENFIPKKQRRSFPMYPYHIQSIIDYRSKLWPHINYEPVREKFLNCTKLIDDKITKFLKNRENVKFKTLKDKFSYIGSFLKSKNTPIPVLNIGNNFIVSDQEKANHIAEYVHSTFSKSPANSPLLIDHPQTIPNLTQKLCIHTQLPPRLYI